MNYEYASTQKTTQNLNQTLRQQIETFSLGIKPIPAQESSDSTQPRCGEVNPLQTQTQQGVQELENLHLSGERTIENKENNRAERNPTTVGV